MTSSQLPINNTNSKAGAILPVDVKRILQRALRYWYVIALFICLTLTGAFLRNRYATKIFHVTASLIVKEADDISGAELLYNNPLINFKRNYLNEPYILKSRPLIRQVIEDLDFDVAFLRMGNIITTEVYGNFPVQAIPIRKDLTTPYEFEFTILSKEEFKLSGANNSNAGESKVFAFNDTISFQGFKGIFKVLDARDYLNFKDETFILRYTPSAFLVNMYAQSLQAEWAEVGAGVLNISINGSNPAKEKDFLSGLITRYQELDLANKNETASRTVDFISGQLAGIADSLKNVERKLERFKNQNVVTDLSAEALRLYQKLEEIEGQKAQLIVSKNYYKYLIDYVKKSEGAHQIILPSSVGIEDQILTDLITRMNELQLNLKMAGKAENPLVAGGVRKVNELKQDIIESVRNQESTEDIKLRFLEKQIAGLEKQLRYLPIAERNLISIQRNYSLLESLYIFLLQKQSEAAISKASNTSGIFLVNPPQAGGQIVPKTTFNYLIAIALGITLPLGLFALVEMFDNRVQSKEDIEEIATIPFIGGVGHKMADTNLAVFNAPKSALAESFRALRSNLNYFTGKNAKAIFVITSSISGEGKTFTSINLASVLSLRGRRTLIVGADLRRPKIFDDFKLSNDFGLSNYLAGLSSFDQVVQKTAYDNLDFISSGPVPPNPSELLLSERMGEFISQAKAVYDFIVIDTPPLAIVTDAFLISDYADHVLFLVRQNYTPKDSLKTVEDLYSSGKLKKMSIVLNDIHKTGPIYDYTYGYYSGKKNDFGYYQ